MSIFVGCAGWTIPKEHAPSFPSQGSHLERYADQFSCVEINSSFYRPHRFNTYQRWAQATPAGFRFSVKLPKQITHIGRLIDMEPLIEQFATETRGLGDKLGAVLVQLPPSLAFDARQATQFFSALQAEVTVPLCCEPRHATWFDETATTILAQLDVARVAADPHIVPEAAVPGGSSRLGYFRWHGSPQVYYSAYDLHNLQRLADQALAYSRLVPDVWCIFDNTAAGAAQPDAQTLMQLLDSAARQR